MNKKGFSTMEMFGAIAAIFVFLLTFGVMIYFFNQVNTSLESVGMAGAVNFTNATRNTFGQFNTGLVTYANWIALGFMFGLFLTLLLNAFVNRGKNIPLFWIVDIILVFLAYIISTYISNAYETIIGYSEFTSTFSGTLNLASTFLLNLPIYVVVFGIIIMVVSYIGFPQTREEQNLSVGGFE